MRTNLMYIKYLVKFLEHSKFLIMAVAALFHHYCHGHHFFLSLFIGAGYSMARGLFHLLTIHFPLTPCSLLLNSFFALLRTSQT